MNVYRESASLQRAATTEADASLQGLIAQRLQELSDFQDIDLAELIHILVIEPSDTSTDVDTELGFSLVDRPWDVVESHPGWFEITVVVSDDGFGWVIYVPRHASTDASLLKKCASYCKESMP